MCEHAVERTPAVQNMSLMASGTPSSGPASPDAMRASDAFAMVTARSGVSSTNALSGRAFSIAATCAAVSSAAEKDFFFSPSRASAKLNDVNSVTVLARPPFVARVVPGSAPLHWRPACKQSWGPQWRYPSSRRFVPLRGRQPLPNIRAHRRCTLFDHLRHQEEIVLAQRRVSDDVRGDTAIGHDVGALLHSHGRDRRHRFDPLDVYFTELLDEGQHRVQFALEVIKLVLRHGNAGEVRDTANGIGVDSH